VLTEQYIMPTKKQLEEQIKELKLELLMTKETSKDYEKQNNEWFKICGCDGLIQDLFYDGYHTTKLISGEVDEVCKAITEMKNKIDELREKNDELCFENDEINRKWAEDNERNGDICSEQQEQIKTLEERQLPFGWTTNTLKNLQEVRDELKEENTEQSTEIINFEGQIKRLEEENERLEEEKQELQSQADRWEGEHSDLWYSVFGALDDGGYSATSTGQLISFIRDIIEENEKLEEEIKKLKS